MSRVGINWTRSGRVGMTADGWMVTASSRGYTVTDSNEELVGVYQTAEEAEAAALQR